MRSLLDTRVHGLALLTSDERIADAGIVETIG